MKYVAVITKVTTDVILFETEASSIDVAEGTARAYLETELSLPWKKGDEKIKIVRIFNRENADERKEF